VGWAVTVGGREIRPTGTVSVGAAEGFDPTVTVEGSSHRPEPADVARLARRGLRAVVRAARVEPEVSVAAVLGAHLGPDAGRWPVVADQWAAYDHVNVHTAVEAWLGDPVRRATIIGLTGFQHRELALGDLLVEQAMYGMPLGIGNVAMVDLPAGPDGEVRTCVRCALWLVEEDGQRSAMLLGPTPDHGMGDGGIRIEMISGDAARASTALAELRRLTLEHNVYRGHVVGFGSEMFGHQTGLSFLRRPHLAEGEVVLPDGVLELVERQVLGIARHRASLQASGQHLKRGVLLHGPPGTGKTQTVRHLLGRLDGVTVVVLSGEALGAIREACSIARVLQPAAIVVEDVDLIAEERGFGPGAHPLLFQLLNEMDGLGEDVDVAFILTTNRADLLEPALAARPGRVDQAVHIPTPDAAGRHRLLDLYRRNLDLRADLGPVVQRTEGVTASFLKELLRRAALAAAEGTSATGESDAPAPIVVEDRHLRAALDELFDDRHQLTRLTVGGTVHDDDRAGRQADHSE
jgi:hypothetical protein